MSKRQVYYGYIYVESYGGELIYCVSTSAKMSGCLAAAIALYVSPMTREVCIHVLCRSGPSCYMWLNDFPGIQILIWRPPCVVCVLYHVYQSTATLTKPRPTVVRVHYCLLALANNGKMDLWEGIFKNKEKRKKISNSCVAAYIIGRIRSSMCTWVSSWIFWGA